MMVYWWCTANNRLFGLAVHICLSLSLPLSFFFPSYFPSKFSKQAKRKTKLRFAERDQVQDAGPTLALDEAASRTELDLELLQRERPRGAVRQDVAEIFSEQTKLSLHQISESKPAAWLALAEFVDWHLCTVDVPITMLKWTWHSRRPQMQNRTENFVRFWAGRTERSDGFSERCAIIFRLSHPVAARFRRSFRNSVCKTSLLLACTIMFGAQIKLRCSTPVVDFFFFWVPAERLRARVTRNREIKNSGLRHPIKNTVYRCIYTPTIQMIWEACGALLLEIKKKKLCVRLFKLINATRENLQIATWKHKSVRLIPWCPAHQAQKQVLLRPFAG